MSGDIFCGGCQGNNKEKQTMNYIELKNKSLEVVMRFFAENPKRKTFVAVFFDDAFRDMQRDGRYPWVFKGSRMAERFARDRDLRHKERVVIIADRTGYAIIDYHPTLKLWQQNPALLNDYELLIAAKQMMKREQRKNKKEKSCA